MSDLEAFISGSPSKTRGPLLDLARRQVASRSARDLVTQWERDGTVMASPVDQRTTVKLDGLALTSALEYEALQLSPVAPLGTNSVVAPTSQDRTLSTTRATEVVSDPTNVLALEAARRLARDPDAIVRLCTCHQTLRMQGVDSSSKRSQHFRLFALADAGRGQPDDGFEVAAVVRQLAVFDRLFDRFETEGFTLADRRAILRSAPDKSVLADRIEAALVEQLRHVGISREPLTSDYYGGLRVGFGANDRSGQFQEIVDLGAFDWVAQLANDARQRFIASGLGIQLVPLLF